MKTKMPAYDECLRCIKIGGNWHFNPTNIFEDDVGECTLEVEYELYDNGTKTKIIEFEDDDLTTKYEDVVESTSGCEQFNSIGPVGAGLAIGAGSLVVIGAAAAGIISSRKRFRTGREKIPEATVVIDVK